jgi:nicotinamidase/pyrazinamidase
MTTDLLDPGYDRATALLLIDVQNDFADPGGALAVTGGDAIIPLLNSQVAAAHASGALVAYTQDWHPASTPHFARDGGIWPVHCVMATWGAELHPNLLVDGPTIRKGTAGEDGYSGFSMRDPDTGRESPTELDGLLRAARIERVVIAGLATDYCVRATALDAVRLGYRTSVLADGIRPVDLAPGDGERALAEMATAGIEVVGQPEAPQ